MTTAELIVAIIVFVLAGIMLILSIQHFCQRGFLLNNAYIYASKSERQKMNKKPYYFQSAISFSLLSVVFVIVGISAVLQKEWMIYIALGFIAAIVIYAITSSVWILKKRKKDE